MAQSRESNLKYRLPIFPSLRHLVLTYYHYYTADYPPESKAKKEMCLIGYTDPIDLVERFGTGWFFKSGDQALEDIYQRYLDGVYCTPINGTQRYLYPPEKEEAENILIGSRPWRE